MSQKEKWLGLEFVSSLILLGLLIYVEQRTLAHLDSSHPLAVRQVVIDKLQSLSHFFPSFYWRFGLHFLFFGLTLCFSPRIRWFLLLGYASFSLLLIIGNLVYFQFFDSFVDVNAFFLLGQATKVRASAFAEMPWSYYLYFIPLFFLVVLGWKLARRSAQSKFENSVERKRYLYLRIFQVLFMIFLGVKILTNAKIYFNSIQLSVPGQREHFVPPYQNSDKEFCLVFGFSNYFWRSVYQKAFPDIVRISEQQVDDAFDLLSQIKGFNDQPSEVQGIAKDMNVILISVEALQPFVLNAHFNGIEITPFLNQMAREGICFDQVIDNGLKGGTSDGELAAMTGLLPDPRFLSSHIYPVKKDLMGLASYLNQFNYSTLSMHGNEGDFWERKKSHKRLGFQKSYFEEDFQSKSPNGFGLLDGDFFQEAAPLLQGQKRPFFCYMISLTAHHPYVMVPDKFMPLPDLAAPLTIRYLRSQHYFDTVFKQFVEDLGETAQHTVFILYGDHAAPGLTNDAKFLQVNFSINIESIRSKVIPIIIWSPSLKGKFSSVQSAQPRSLNDIFPTVCDLLGLQVPFAVSGQNLLLDKDRIGLPLAKYNGFSFGTGVYMWNGEPVFDDRGFVFSGEPLSLDQLQQGVIGAFRVKMMQENLYDGNLQPELIRRFEQKNLSSEPQLP